MATHGTVSPTVPTILLNSNNNSFSSPSTATHSRSQTPTLRSVSIDPRGRTLSPHSKANGGTSALSPGNTGGTSTPKSKALEKEATYRDIFVTINEGTLKAKTQTLKPSVSFDTVSVSYSKDGREDFHLSSDDDDDANDEFSPEGRGRPNFSKDRSPSPFSGGRSPSPGGSLFSQCAIERSAGIQFDSRGFRIDYPSHSAVTKDSYTRTSEHPDYMEYVKTNLGRTLLVYISGRRHTWVCLDYVIAKLLRDGDHLVVISRIPSAFKDGLVKDHHSGEVDSAPFNAKSQRIQKYIKCLLKGNPIVKITVDLYLARTTMGVINEAMHIYYPSMICVAQKPNFRFSQSSHSWSTSRMSARLFKNSHIPLAIVSSMKMNKFEVELFNSISEKNDWHLENAEALKIKLQLLNASSTPSASFISHSTKGYQSDTSDIESDDDNEKTDSSSMTSDDSSILSDPEDEVQRVLNEFQESLTSYMDKSDKSKIKPTTFIDRLNKLSDASGVLSAQLEEISQSERGDELVRTVTMMPQMVKQKSMLDVLETDAGVSNKIKSQLMGKTSSQPTSIKFDSNALSPRGSKHLSPLRKVQTTLISPSSSQRRHSAHELEPMRSHQVMSKSFSETKVPTMNEKSDEDDKKVKRRGFFKKIFGK